MPKILFVLHERKWMKISQGSIICSKGPFSYQPFKFRKYLTKFCRLFITIRWYILCNLAILWHFTASFSHQWNSLILNYIKQQIHLILSNLTISWYHFLRLSVCFKHNSFKFWGFWTHNKKAEPQGKKSILQLLFNDN